MSLQTREQFIENEWFKNHKATLEKHGDLEVLTWKDPKTFMYGCRFVFDGTRLHVTGDIGTASFWFTEEINVHSFENDHVHSFAEKLECMNGDKYSYDSESVVEELKDWTIELEDEGKKYNGDEMDILLEYCESSSSCEEWTEIVYQNLDFIMDLDQSYYEWIYDIGKEYSSRLVAYLVALKMASKQLKETQYENN